MTDKYHKAKVPPQDLKGTAADSTLLFSSRRLFFLSLWTLFVVFPCRVTRNDYRDHGDRRDPITAPTAMDVANNNNGHNGYFEKRPPRPMQMRSFTLGDCRFMAEIGGAFANNKDTTYEGKSLLRFVWKLCFNTNVYN